MNIFILDKMPEQAAKYSVDAHVRSGLIEVVSLLGFAYDDGKFEPWKWLRHSNRHFNHPASRWTRDSRQNFSWALIHAYSLAEEFTYRFGKTHKCLSYLDWISHNLPLDNLRDFEQTPWPRCFGPFKEKLSDIPDTIFAYREYYRIAKNHLIKYTKRERPEWL